MEKILSQVSMLQYKDFRREAIRRCGWSPQQYANRYTGNTKLTDAEREVLQSIVNKMKEEQVKGK